MKSITSFIGLIINMISVLFITLRACDIISWDWWAVMLPQLIVFGFAVLLTLISGLIVGGENDNQSK